MLTKEFAVVPPRFSPHPRTWEAGCPRQQVAALRMVAGRRPGVGGALHLLRRRRPQWSLLLKVKGYSRGAGGSVQ